jgi:hypothetical protein
MGGVEAVVLEPRQPDEVCRRVISELTHIETRPVIALSCTAIAIPEGPGQ